MNSEHAVGKSESTMTCRLQGGRRALLKKVLRKNPYPTTPIIAQKYYNKRKRVMYNQQHTPEAAPQLHEILL